RSLGGAGFADRVDRGDLVVVGGGVGDGIVVVAGGAARQRGQWRGALSAGTRAPIHLVVGDRRPTVGGHRPRQVHRRVPAGRGQRRRPRHRGRCRGGGGGPPGAGVGARGGRG